MTTITPTHTLSLTFTTLDVFTTTRFGGNPLALILLQSDQKPNQTEKQAIAREFNYSETVFLHLSDDSRQKAEWTYDIFTTESELPFAGHPTIGTAWYLAKLYPQLLSHSETTSARLIAKAGPVELRFERRDKDVYATASIPHNVHIHSSTLNRDHLLEMQPGLATYQQELADSSPVVSIVKGMTFAYIRVPSMSALRAIKLSTLPSEQFIKLDDAWSPSFTATYFYYIDEENSNPGEEKYKLNCRMIETAFGEDAATGSGSAGLAAYLAMERRKPGVGGGNNEDNNLVQISIDQGVEMGRPSRIDIEVELTSDGQVKRISQSGSCVHIMSGRLE